MKTTDIDSLTNSVMQAMAKELVKNGIGASFHRAYNGNRQMVSAMITMIVADHMNNEGKLDQKQAPST